MGPQVIEGLAHVSNCMTFLPFSTIVLPLLREIYHFPTPSAVLTSVLEGRGVFREEENVPPDPLCRKMRESQQTEGGSGTKLPELTRGLKPLNRFSPCSQTGLVSDEKSSAQTLRNRIIVLPGSLGAWLPSGQLRGVLWGLPSPASSCLSCRGQHSQFPLENAPGRRRM